MATVRFRPLAASDLERIWHYTLERSGADQAVTYTNRIADTCHNLANGNLPGVDISDIRAGYRKQVSGRHVIYFRAVADQSETIAVIRILHHSMDATTRLATD
ncbi:MAG: type II toxin-antitoxin system RelE/ParE family toxin [Alphaproteobacteria bacterium]